MEKESKPEELGNVLEFLNNLTLDEKDFNKIYEKINRNLKLDPSTSKILTKIKEKSKMENLEEKEILIQLLSEMDVEELLGLFQGKDLNEFIQDFLLKKML
jgi:hypothetical protein